MVRLRRRVVKVKFSSSGSVAAENNKGWLLRHPLLCVDLVRLLAFADAIHLRAADWARSLGGGLAVLHGHLLRVLHLSLRSALQAIRFHTGCSFLSSRCGCPSPLCLVDSTVSIYAGSLAVPAGNLLLYLAVDTLLAMISFSVSMSSESTLILRKIFYSAANTRSGCQRPNPLYRRMARNSPSFEYARHGVSTSS